MKKPNQVKILIVLFVTLLLACSKKENPYIISGYMYKNDSIPHANTSFEFFDREYTTLFSQNGGDTKTTPFTTDENGYFSVAVVLLGDGRYLYIRKPPSSAEIIKVNISASE